MSVIDLISYTQLAIDAARKSETLEINGDHYRFDIYTLHEPTVCGTAACLMGYMSTMVSDLSPVEALHLWKNFSNTHNEQCNSIGKFANLIDRPRDYQYEEMGLNFNSNLSRLQVVNEAQRLLDIIKAVFPTYLVETCEYQND